MAASTVMPKNWTDFLRIDENKAELFAFLSPEAIRLPLIGTVGRSEGTPTQQTEVELSALLLNHAWPALLHVRKRRRTLANFCMR